MNKKSPLQPHCPHMKKIRLRSCQNCKNIAIIICWYYDMEHLILCMVDDIVEEMLGIPLEKLDIDQFKS